jgi:L-rhamnose-H+ transport protein
MAGGFLVNGLWCLFLSLRNGALGPNYGWGAIAGVTWYLGFMFYGIGTTFMGRYDFTSWSIQLAFVIVFSTLCGIASGEWRPRCESSCRALKLDYR